MIKINDIQDSPADLYDPDGNKVGTIETMLQFNDVRLQILKQRLEGYVLHWKGLELELNNDGTLQSWPNDLFDITEKQMAEMVHLRNRKEEKS